MTAIHGRRVEGEDDPGKGAPGRLVTGKAVFRIMADRGAVVRWTRMVMAGTGAVHSLSRQIRLSSTEGKEHEMVVTCCN